MYEEKLVAAIHEGLGARADAEKAAPMQAYMKSEMPFYGVQAKPRQALFRDVFQQYPLADAATWEATVLHLWRTARYREDRYAAIDLAGLRRYRPFRTPAVLPMYEEMIVVGAWWDLVDPLASAQVGEVLRRFPEKMKPEMRAWAVDEERWKRRTAIISQLGHKAETDTDLLHACIAPSMPEGDFFLRKAIGWALRQYARTDPDWVRTYVAAHEDRLSALSKREALKHL